MDDAEKSYIDSLKHLQTLNSYSNDELTENQVITKKIAIFDTENDINEFEDFRM